MATELQPPEPLPAPSLPGPPGSGGHGRAAGPGAASARSEPTGPPAAEPPLPPRPAAARPRAPLAAGPGIRGSLWAQGRWRRDPAPARGPRLSRPPVRSRGEWRCGLGASAPRLPESRGPGRGAGWRVEGRNRGGRAAAVSETSRVDLSHAEGAERAPSPEHPCC